MLTFFIGVIVGGIVGFLICAILSINNSEKGRSISNPVSKETGDNDAPSN